MIPNTQVRSVLVSDDSPSASFGISRGDEAHLMTVLRDTLYSDKVLAVLREYGSNAWDANRDAGKGHTPIKVTLPTLAEPTLEIRDYGHGLSRAEVFGLFTQYGASTKRDSNSMVGCLGIGSKAGFAYSDSFTVISRHDGVCSTYVCILDESNKGEVRLLDECYCDDTGLAIRVTVRPNDINEFVNKAKDLYAYMQPQPYIGCEAVVFGEISTGDVWGDKWIAVMGCVPYPVDLDQIRVPNFARKLGAVLRFDIGELQIAASREALKYSQQTKIALERRICAFLDKYVADKLTVLESGTLTQWQQRLEAQKLQVFSELKLLNPYRHLFEADVDFAIDLFKGGGRKVSKKLPIRSQTRLIVRNDKRSLRGFNFGYWDYVINVSPTAAILTAKVEGITVAYTSELPWTPQERAPSNHNVKHKKKCFILCANNGFRRPFSDHWAPIERVPESDDVYVLLDKFWSDNLQYIHSDYALLEWADLPTPPIFGYKRDIGNKVGIPYSEFRKTIAARVLAAKPKLQADLDALIHLAEFPWISGRNADKVVVALGTDHPISKLIALNKRIDDGNDRLRWLQKLAPSAVNTENPYEAVLKRWPLLKAQVRGIQILWDNEYGAEWLNYVKL